MHKLYPNIKCYYFFPSFHSVLSFFLILSQPVRIINLLFSKRHLAPEMWLAAFPNHCVGHNSLLFMREVSSLLHPIPDDFFIFGEGLDTLWIPPVTPPLTCEYSGFLLIWLRLWFATWDFSDLGYSICFGLLKIFLRNYDGRCAHQLPPVSKFLIYICVILYYLSEG